MTDISPFRRASRHTYIVSLLAIALVGHYKYKDSPETLSAYFAKSERHTRTLRLMYDDLLNILGDLDDVDVLTLLSRALPDDMAIKVLTLRAGRNLNSIYAELCITKLADRYMDMPTIARAGTTRQ